MASWFSSSSIFRIPLEMMKNDDNITGIPKLFSFVFGIERNRNCMTRKTSTLTEATQAYMKTEELDFADRSLF